MIGKERKAKDDFIGGKDFSRVRRFDDEARKDRIFASNSANSVDVPKLELQVKEKGDFRLFDIHLKKEEENLQAFQKEIWNREEEHLRKQRIQARSSLEEYWEKQHEEFKERWKLKKDQEPLNEKVGIIPTKRYDLQDAEALRDAEVTRRVSEARHQQIEDCKLRELHEVEDERQHDLQQEIARKHWEKAQDEIARKLRSSNIDLAKEYLHQHLQKIFRDKKRHDEEHFYDISEDFFNQFEKSSR